MLEKETEFLCNYSPQDRDETVIFKSWKRDAGNSFQFDRIIKSSKPSSPTVSKLLNGTGFFKQKVYFEPQIQPSHLDHFLRNELETNSKECWKGCTKLCRY